VRATGSQQELVYRGGVGPRPDKWFAWKDNVPACRFAGKDAVPAWARQRTAGATPPALCRLPTTVACVLPFSTREFRQGCASTDCGRQAAGEAAQTQEVKRHLDGLYAKAAQVARKHVLALEQAAGKSAVQAEGDNRHKQKRGASQACRMSELRGCPDGVVSQCCAVALYLYATFVCKHAVLTHRSPLSGVVSSRMPESARGWRRRPQISLFESLWKSAIPACCRRREQSWDSELIEVDPWDYPGGVTVCEIGLALLHDKSPSVSVPEIGQNLRELD